MSAAPRLDLFNADPASAPFRLSKLIESDGAFVSCYLDARRGPQACLRFLNQKAAQIRDRLRGIDRFCFDSAIEKIRCSLTNDWRPQQQGVAIFARGTPEGSQLTVLHSQTPLDNRLVRYSQPEVLPLVALHQWEPAFRLLIIGEHELRLVESRLGAEVRHVVLKHPDMAETLELVEQSATLAERRIVGPFPEEAVQQLHMALGMHPLPLLIAGSPNALRHAADWLPSRATDALLGTLPASPQSSVDDLLVTARRRMRAISREESTRLADGLVDDAHLRPRTVLGNRPTLAALQRGNVEAVVLADWDSPGLGLPYESLIDISLVALRHGARVIVADSVRLRKAGGVGCLLKRPEFAQIPARSYATLGLGQVA